jgi:colanic acid biosynthesis protein WcaH
MTNAPALTDDELQTLERILAKLDGRHAHLPYPLFRFITEVAATANIDLIVQNADGQTLLAWRDDAAGTGWHVPGSIVRHREEIADRLEACADDEFAAPLASTTGPIALIQIFDDRGHSLSLCYRATLDGPPGKPVITAHDAPKGGDLRWFATPPEDLYPSHRVYRDLLTDLNQGRLTNPIPLFTQRVGNRDAAPAQGGIITADAPLTE